MAIGARQSWLQTLTPWLGLAAVIVALDQATKLAIERLFSYGDVHPVTSFFNLVLTYNKGNHGWDPATPNMGALFIAHGPSFRRGVEIPDVENIHLYNLLCAALGLTPAPNDGDQRLVQAALAK